MFGISCNQSLSLLPSLSLSSLSPLSLSLQSSVAVVPSLPQTLEAEDSYDSFDLVSLHHRTLFRNTTFYPLCGFSTLSPSAPVCVLIIFTFLCIWIKLTYHATDLAFLLWINVVGEQCNLVTMAALKYSIIILCGEYVFVSGKLQETNNTTKL